MKVSLCTPVHDTTKARFTVSLFDLGLFIAKAQPDVEIDLRLLHKSSRIDNARQTIAEAALARKADWLLWLDADQTFPPDTLLRLLAHDLPFVGCNCRKRDPDAVKSTARRNGRPLQPKAEGVEAVDSVGFGVTLTNADLFRELPRPWFQSGPHGEDGYFCEQAIKAGYQPHVDHALSMEVGHIAETVLHFPR